MNTTKTMIKRVAAGASGLALIVGLAHFQPIDKTIIAREVTISGDITYRKDSSGNITASSYPVVRCGSGGVTKYTMQKDSEKYQELNRLGG